MRGAERDTQAAHQWLSALRGEPDSSFSERHQVSFGGRWPDMDDDDDDDDGRKAAFLGAGVFGMEGVFDVLSQT